MLEINSDLEIPDEEIEFSVSTSRGPGGQKVNRVRTRVRLAFNVRTSPSLSEDQRERILERLGSRIQASGRLSVQSEKHRTQHANRVAAEQRLTLLLREALREETPRRPTRPTPASRRRRLEEKRRRGKLKESRGTTPDTD